MNGMADNGQYVFPVESDGVVPPDSPMDALFKEVVYRSAGKDTLEVKKAIRKVCEHFIRTTGVWKHRFSACPFQERPGWWLTVAACEGVVLHVDDVEGCGGGAAGHPSAFPHGVAGASGFGTQVEYRHIGENMRAGEIRFDMTEARRIVFCTSSSLYRSGLVSMCAGHGTPFGAYAPNTGSSVTPPTTPAMYPDGMHERLPERVFLLATLGMRFGSNHFPSWIVERWGDALCDGAAHILAAWPSVTAETAWGVSYNGTVEDIIARISAGGMFSNGSQSVISPEVPRQ